MKKILLGSVVLLTFGVGLFVGVFISRENDTQSKIIATEQGTVMYSYYLDRSGKEIKHGWEFRISANGERQERKKFVDGRETDSDLLFYSDSSKRR